MAQQSIVIIGGKKNKKQENMLPHCNLCRRNVSVAHMELGSIMKMMLLLFQRS